MTPYNLRARLSAAIEAGVAAFYDLDNTPPDLTLEGVISVAVLRDRKGERFCRLAGSPESMTAYAVGAALWKLGGEIMSDAEVKS